MCVEKLLHSWAIIAEYPITSIAETALFPQFDSLFFSKCVTQTGWAQRKEPLLDIHTFTSALLENLEV